MQEASINKMLYQHGEEKSFIPRNFDKPNFPSDLAGRTNRFFFAIIIE